MEMGGAGTKATILGLDRRRESQGRCNEAGHDERRRVRFMSEPPLLFNAWRG